jgi:2-phospho-L-lactate guanylyltransferase
MSAGCWAIVPVKARVACKSRLAGRLSSEARIRLVRLMLNRVIAALQSASTVARITIVSPERDSLADDIAVLEDKGEGLNVALDGARRTLVSQGADELLILPADLPFVTALEIDSLVEAGRQSGFALAGDAAGVGTNAIYLSPPSSFRFQFGPGSRTRHLVEAARLGWHPQLVRADGLEFDLDVVDDVARFAARDGAAFKSLPTLTDGGTWLLQEQTG